MFDQCVFCNEASFIYAKLLFVINEKKLNIISMRGGCKMSLRFSLMNLVIVIPSRTEGFV